jgi:hypothetical protein
MARPLNQPPITAYRHKIKKISKPSILCFFKDSSARPGFPESSAWWSVFEKEKWMERNNTEHGMPEEMRASQYVSTRIIIIFFFLYKILKYTIPVVSAFFSTS